VFSRPKAEATRALVFPDMASGDGAPSTGYGQLVRLIFDGSVTTKRPLIASMAIDCGIAANILGASTRTVGKREYGYMLIEIPGGPDELARAMKYISATPNVIAQADVEYAGKEAAE
jgi:D-methionine transport system ATP-binding protein